MLAAWSVARASRPREARALNSLTFPQNSSFLNRDHLCSLQVPVFVLTENRFFSSSKDEVFNKPTSSRRGTAGSPSRARCKLYFTDSLTDSGTNVLGSLTTTRMIAVVLSVETIVTIVQHASTVECTIATSY